VLRAIRAALDRGVTTQQIADALGIKQAKYVYTLMLRLKKAPSPTNAPDKPKRKYTPKLSPKEVKTILGLIQEGHSTESIAEAAKVSTRTVQRIGRKYLHEPVSPIK
jgi:DNA-binding NarL/FixJ family response regulator